MLLHFSLTVSSLLISKCINYHVHITAGKLPRAGVVAPHSQELGLEPGRQKKKPRTSTTKQTKTTVRDPRGQQTD